MASKKKKLSETCLLPPKKSAPFHLFEPYMFTIRIPATLRQSWHNHEAFVVDTSRLIRKCLASGVGAQHTAEASEKIHSLEKYLKKINIPKSNGVTVILRSGQRLPVHEEVHEMIKLYKVLDRIFIRITEKSNKKHQKNTS